MRKLFFLLMLTMVQYAHGQLSVNILMPPGGIMDKQQLWNIVATNTESVPITVQAQIRFSDVSNGQTVFVCNTSSFDLSTGTTQLNANNIGLIYYNIVSPDYRIDPGPSGLLPIGTFNVCYEFLITKYNKMVQECQQITIPPLSPLLLVQPFNGTTLEDFHPTFSWVPPSPLNSLTNLRFDLRLIEVLPNQSEADAMQDNLPLFTISGLSNATFPYLQNSPALEADKKYAWQVIAKNNLTLISKSEVWSFVTKKEIKPMLVSKPEPVYVKLKKEGVQDGSAVFWGNIRFDYINETNDDAWHILVEDLTASSHISFVLPVDTIKIKRGQNLIDYKAINDERFKDKHQYILKLLNTRNEVWQLRFEYRKPE